MRIGRDGRIARTRLLAVGLLGIVALATGPQPWARAAENKVSGAAQKPITLDEAENLAARFFDAVSKGTAADQSALFLDPNSRIVVIWDGTTFNFAEHAKLHKQWINEVHLLGHLDLMTINDSPPRVRVTGTVYWEAELPGKPKPNVIKAVVGEDWIIERKPSGDLAFVLYLNTFHHVLPDSAPLPW